MNSSLEEEEEGVFGDMTYELRRGGWTEELGQRGSRTRREEKRCLKG